MELIEGEPLAEHFASLKEKQQRFTEERIWNIFIQVENQKNTFRCTTFENPMCSRVYNSFCEKKTANFSHQCFIFPKTL